MRSSFSKKLSGTAGDIDFVALIPLGVLATMAIIALVFLFFTESGKRAIVDLKSDVGGGLNRTIRVYTANGDLLAEYKGKIDLDANEGGYVKFDFEGKRYTYYNCFVESIADIE